MLLWKASMQGHVFGPYTSLSVVMFALRPFHHEFVMLLYLPDDSPSDAVT